MDADFYIQQAIEGLRSLTSAHAATWHPGDEENWAVDQDTGRIEFEFSDGIVAEADVQLVGKYMADTPLQAAQIRIKVRQIAWLSVL